MSTFTPRLQLKRNDGSDPFKRQDFVDNWNKMDAAPGVHVCTSTSRPTWGSAQAGRTILETNTRAMYEWSGTAWLPILTAPSGWTLGIAPGAYLAPDTQAVYTLGTITTTRPGTLMVDLSAVMACIDTTQQSTTIVPQVDGVIAAGGGSTGFKQWTGSNNNGGYNVYDTMNSKGSRAVAAGNHTIQARIYNHGLSSLSVLAYRVMANVILVNETSR